MKKLTAFLLTLALAIGLTACGSGSGKGGKQSGHILQPLGIGIGRKQL